MKRRYDREMTAEEMAKVTDEDIDFSDIPDLDPKLVGKGILVQPDNKTQLTLRLDPTVVLWFKSQGPRYQTRMNAVLRAYYEAQTSGKQAPRQRKIGSK